MKRQKKYLAAALAVAAFATGLAAQKAATRPDPPGITLRGLALRKFISQSALLIGLAPSSLFPFIDTTPNMITRTHIAITDATGICAAGAAPPANMQVLVGQAGVALVNVMTAGTNTGIGTSSQCVFHVTVVPGVGGVPATITDVVLVNAGSSPLTGINTVTASAEVEPVLLPSLGAT